MIDNLSIAVHIFARRVFYVIFRRWDAVSKVGELVH